MVFVILGMHRSGTSLVARMLHEMEINMGDDLLAGDEGNPSGYFEDMGFLELNKRILGAARGSWKNPPTEHQIDTVAHLFKSEIAPLVDKRNKQAKWGFKDPRTCLTIKTLHPYLTKPKYIIVRRNKTAVARSLERLHGDADWESLHHRYSLEIQKFKAAHPEDSFLEINYEELLGDSFTVFDLADYIKYDGDWCLVSEMIKK